MVKALLTSDVAVGWVQVGIAIISMVGLATYTVGEVRISTAMLATEINHLSSTIELVREDQRISEVLIHDIEVKVIQMEGRVMQLESTLRNLNGWNE